MKQVFLAAILGAVIVFLWGFLSWTVVQFHDATYKSLRSGDDVANMLKSKLDENGVYFYPGDLGDTESAEDMDRLAEKHRQGPLFTIIYIKKGKEMMSPIIFLKGFLVFFIAAFIISFITNLVKESLPTFIKRLVFVSSFALFAGLVSYISNHVWLYYPISYSLVMALDVLFGWVLAGVVIAAIIKPTRKYTFT